MKNLILKLNKSLLCIVLSVSMVCTTTAATTYQAAAIPVVYTGWQTLVTIFALLGITICAAPELEEEAAQEVIDAYVGWKVLKGEGQGDNDGDGEDDLFSTFDPLDWLIGDKLTIPEEDLNDWQDFAREQGWTPNYESDVFFDDISDLKSLTYNEFLEVLPIIFPGIKTSGDFSQFANYIYNNCLDFCFFFSSSDSTYSDYYFNCIKFDTSYGYYLHNTGTYYTLNSNKSDGLYSFGISYRNYVADYWNDSYSVSFSSKKNPIVLCVNGLLYDFNSVFSTSGNLVFYNDFVVPDNHFGNSLTDSMNSINSTNLGQLVESGDYDVIGGGRDYDDDKKEAVGDITVSMPSSDILEAYQTGAITYEQMLEALGVTPIDESAGTNLLTDEFLTTQTGILAGVEGILDFLGGLVQNLADMIAGLFIPSEGFFDNYFTQLDEFLSNKLGVLYLPVDLLIDILNALVSSDKSDTSLHFPGIKFQEYVIVPEQDVDLDVSGTFPFLQTAAHFITSSILTFALVIQLRDKLKGVMKR